MPKPSTQWEDPHSQAPDPHNHLAWSTWTTRNSNRMACTADPANPAWIDPAKADARQIAQARATCAACPLLTECRKWSETDVYLNFEGVLAGQVIGSADTLFADVG